MNEVVQERTLPLQISGRGPCFFFKHSPTRRKLTQQAGLESSQFTPGCFVLFFAGVLYQNATDWKVPLASVGLYELEK